MAVDEELSARMRNALEGLEGLKEKKMMGGICFLHQGNMVGFASRTKWNDGQFLFRVGNTNYDNALLIVGAKPLEMGGKIKSGLIHVDADECSDSSFHELLSFALSFVMTLPPKAE